MSDVVIRKGWDRMRYAVSFEVILLILIIPVYAYVTDRELEHTTILGVCLSSLALLFNMVYNYCFDLLDVRQGNIPTERSVKGRIIHALCFEVLLTIICLPIIVWWMDIGWWFALGLDLFFTLFTTFYTFWFTLGYDKLFPLTQPASVPC